MNRVFSESFTDRYSRDGLVGVRVPYLNPLVWRYAIDDAAEGAMIWRDEHGAVAGFNIAHRSGTEGWMGPLAVRPDRQGRGLGSIMVRCGIDWLKESGATTIGLETMPRTVENIGFYSKLGLIPGPMTVTLVRDGQPSGTARPSRLAAVQREVDTRIAECRALTAALSPGVDFTRELALTYELALGDTTLWYEEGALAGFALWHSAPLAVGRLRDELRILKIVARSSEVFARVVDSVQASAAAERIPRVSLRCQTTFGPAYLGLIRAGFRVHWTDLRMTLEGYPEADPREGIVMSNWEI